MSDKTDLSYDRDTLAGALREDEVRRTEKWFHDHKYSFTFDKSWINHLRHYHGGVPFKGCFKTEAGKERLLERFYNFVEDSEDHPLGQYHVESVWALVEDRMGDHLLPFASLFGGDMLCFDYSGGGRPSIVVWKHEESEEDEPVTEPVTQNFDKFLQMLYEPPPRLPKRARSK